jgi:hypothetical protein
MLRIRVAIVLAFLATATVVVTGVAQPVRREVLKELQLSETGGCQHVTAELQFPFSVDGYAPVDGGSLLVVRVTPLQVPEATGPALAGREALVPNTDADTPLQSIEWEGDGPEGPLLMFRFAHPVTYDVNGGKDFRSVVITLHPDTTDPAPCQDVPPSAAHETEP